jgi:hypothetical protein
MLMINWDERIRHRGSIAMSVFIPLEATNIIEHGLQTACQVTVRVEIPAMSPSSNLARRVPRQTVFPKR